MGRLALLKLVEKSEFMVSRFTVATGGGAGDSVWAGELYKLRKLGELRELRKLGELRELGELGGGWAVGQQWELR